MAEARGFRPRAALTEPHDDHRGTVACCRRAAALGLGVGMLLGTIASPPAPRLVWNATASAPIGLYRVVRTDRFQVGDMVVARMPEPTRSLAAERHYVPAGVPLVKRVAAVVGNHICAVGARITINGRMVARRLAADPTGRALPWWHGCRRLARGEYLLLNNSPRSFDGRYFGPISAVSIIGKAVPLWLR